MLKWKLLLAGVSLLAAGSLEAAGTISTYSTRPSFGSNATVDWGGLGATFGPGLLVGTGFNSLPSSAPAAAVSGSSPSLLSRVDQGVNYLGNFAPGDRLLMTTTVVGRGLIPRAPGPIRFTFSTGPVFGAGLQISTNVPGSFTATLTAFDVNGAIIGTASALANSTSPPVGDNTAPFLGIRSSLAEIAAVEVDVPGLTGVTVNRMEIGLTATVVPTAPGTTGKITTYTTALSYGGDAVVDWGALGTASAAQLLIGNFLNLASNAPPVAVSGSASLADLARVDQGATYLGNFAPGDKLLFTSGVAPRGGQPPSSPGPIHFTFSPGPVYGVGLQLSTNVLGPFTATLKAFNAQGVLLGTVTATGNSTLQTAGDNSAPFLGIRSSAQEIAAVDVDIPGKTGIAVNKMKIGLSGSLLSIDSFFVSLQYRDFLNLQPDPAAVANSVAQLSAGTTTRAQIAQSFFLDPRFQTNGMFVAKTYIAALQLDPDFATWQLTLGLMNTGTTQDGVLNTFLATPQAQAIWGNPACVNGAPGCTTDSAYVILLYQNLLGRAPEPRGFAYWAFLLDNGFLSREQAMMGFIQSPEYSARINNRALANLLYLGFLRRTGDAVGINFWTVTLNFGVPLLTVIQDFIATPEYLARFV
jgi:hypothetical protein